MSGSRDDAKNRKVDEMKLAQRFLNAFQNKVDQIRLRGDARTFELEDKERQILLEINNLGLMEGFAAGFISLFLLRRVRSSVMRRYQQKISNMPHQGPPGSASAAEGVGVPNSPFQQSSGPLPPPQGEPPITRGGFTFLNVFGWIVDGMVSFSVAVFASVTFTDRKKIFDKMSSIPLVEGRSKVSTEFCPVVLFELEEISKDPRNRELLKEPVTGYLAAIKEFGENCQIRAAYERKLRRERGLSETDPFSIPPPGVPKELGLQLTNTEDGADGWSVGEPQFYEPESDQFAGDSTGWADSLTTDQEDSRQE